MIRFTLAVILAVSVSTTDELLAQETADHVLVLMDRTGSMMSLRSAPPFNTRCADAFTYARDQVDAWHMLDTPPKISVWSFTGGGIMGGTGMQMHQSYTDDRLLAIDALNAAESLGCDGASTPIAEILCTIEAAIPVTTGTRLIYIVTDGEDNGSRGPCAGPDSGTPLPPFTAGSWQSSVWNQLDGRGVVFSSVFWHENMFMFGPGLSPEPTLDFFSMLASATGGNAVVIEDYEPIPGANPEMPALARRFVRGDCSPDGVVDIGDAVASLLPLFGGTSFDCRGACDANDDGQNNIADAISLLTAVFFGSVLPYPAAQCGGDPTEDTLTCVSYAAGCP